MPIQAVLQGAGLISGLVRFDVLDSGRCAECRITLGSLENSRTHCVSDQFLFNLSSFYSEKKQILLKSVEILSKKGQSRVTHWGLLEDVETAYGRFYYSLLCGENSGQPLMPGDTLIFRLVAEDRTIFTEESFLDAPASTFNGFQAALVIKFPNNNKQMLSGGQFEVVR